MAAYIGNNEVAVDEISLVNVGDGAKVETEKMENQPGYLQQTIAIINRLSIDIVLMVIPAIG